MNDSATPAPSSPPRTPRASDYRDRQLLLEERAALRRVASLVAHGSEPTLLFAAVARELRQLLGAEATRIVRDEPDGAATVVALDGWAFDELPTKLTTPIVVDGRPWGAAAAAWLRPRREPARLGEQMVELTEILAIAIADGQACIELRRLRAALGQATPSVGAAHLGEMLDPRDRASAEEWGTAG